MNCSNDSGVVHMRVRLAACNDAVACGANRRIGGREELAERRPSVACLVDKKALRKAGKAFYKELIEAHKPKVVVEEAPEESEE